MLKGVHDEPRKSELRKEEAHAQVGRKDGGTCARGRAHRRGPSLPQREHRASAVVPVETEVSSRRNRKPQRHQARSETKRRSKDCGNEIRDRASVTGVARNIDRTSSNEKKESLGLEGSLYGRHLTKIQREALREFIDEARRSDSVETICKHLQIHPRSFFTGVGSNKFHFPS